MVKPGTSALFLVVEHATPDKAVEAMAPFGGTVLKSSLSKDAEAQLQEALHGADAARRRLTAHQPPSPEVPAPGDTHQLRRTRGHRPRVRRRGAPAHRNAVAQPARGVVRAGVAVGLVGTGSCGSPSTSPRAGAVDAAPPAWRRAAPGR